MGIMFKSELDKVFILEHSLMHCFKISKTKIKKSMRR